MSKAQTLELARRLAALCTMSGDSETVAVCVVYTCAASSLSLSAAIAIAPTQPAFGPGLAHLDMILYQYQQAAAVCKPSSWS